MALLADGMSALPGWPLPHAALLLLTMLQLRIGWEVGWLAAERLIHKRACGS
jgi:hypothetical protein